MLPLSRSVPFEFPKVHTGPIYCVCFNPSGEYVLTSSQDRSAALYNAESGRLIKHYKNLHNYDVFSVDISRDGSKFVSGGGDKTVIITDVVTGKTVRKFMGHTQRVNCVGFAAEERLLFSASYDTTVRFWDNRDNCTYPVQILKGFKDSVTEAKVMNPQIVCCSMDGTLRTYDMRRGLMTQDAIHHPIQKMAINNSQNAIALSCVDDAIILLQSKTGRDLQDFLGHQVGEYSIGLSFCPDDTYIVSGSTTGQVYVYDLMKKAPIQIVKCFNRPLSAVAVDQKGAVIVAGHEGKVARIEKEKK